MDSSGSPLKVAYSVPQLARLAGMSRWSMVRLLRSAGVTLHRIGHKRLVFLSEVRRALPALWESLDEYESLS